MAVEDTVTKVKQANPDALYVCDPVMGAPDKGCIVALGIAENLLNRLMPMADVIYLAKRPHFEFAKAPVGAGDLISAIFTAGLLKGWTPKQAFQHCHDACYGVLNATYQAGEWELQTIAAQQEFVEPSKHFPLEEVSHVGLLFFETNGESQLTFCFLCF